MNQIWECEFCGKQFDSADVCRRHEKRCRRWDKEHVYSIDGEDGWVKKRVFWDGWDEHRFFPKEIEVKYKSGKFGTYVLRSVSGEVLEI